MIEIRAVNADDWMAWRALRLRALQEASFAFSSTYEEWKDAPESRWRQRLQIPRALNLIAYLDDSPVGMASGMPGERAKTIELVSMWVDPSARGTGAGGVLIDAIEKWASARAEELWLAVVPGNHRAIGLYSRHGFDPVDEPGDPLRDGSGHEILMRKMLGSHRSNA
ncbi:MAG TPA: GNAT family N-acetyltransferase [Humibacter sp.]|nr:GNAT family N-acetyltransferase [Humibacter sp.]